MEGEESSKAFPIGESVQQRGLGHVPECYKVSPSLMPSQNPPETANVPVVDLVGLMDHIKRSAFVEDIRNACLRHGFFQIINHGIPQSTLDGALSTASNFFNLPNEAKMEFMSNDVHKPIRYGTSLRDGVDKIQSWRVFLKHYAHPLNDWIEQWPVDPPEYRDKMGEFALEVRKVAIELMGALTESLGIGPKYLQHKMEEGMQVMAINCYPPCPQPSLALGLPPHSDYSCFTILLQSSTGLEILDMSDNTWRLVPDIKGALQVNIGDQVEVLSNGTYKSLVHRVRLSRDKTRLSIASLHSLRLDEKMETAKELVDEEHPRGYKESSFRDFLNFLTNNDISDGKSYIDTLKIN